MNDDQSSTLTDTERLAVYALANGDRAALPAAAAAFERCGASCEDSPEMRFMSEVLAPVPDLLLRARYRRDLLTAPSARAEVTSR